MDTYMLVYIYKLNPNCSMVQVFQLHNILSDGYDDINDRKTSARPKIVTENAMKLVRVSLSENCRRI